MKYGDVISELKKKGTAQNRKIYLRHGAGPKLYGVSFAELKKLVKKIGIDHDLSLKLWKTKNTDAMTLSLFVCDPSMFKLSELEKMVKDFKYHLIASYFASVVFKTRFSKKLFAKWIKSKDETISTTGWNILSSIANSDEKISNSFFEKYLKIIEKNIHNAKNRTKHSMNLALICIGGRNKDLKLKAIASAKKIGKVDVDHGETSCKTPDAISYIEKIWKRNKKKSCYC